MIPLPRTDRSSPAAILAVLAAAGTVFSLNQSLVIPALPQVQAALHTSQGGATWIITANLLSTAVFTTVLGRLGDMYGKHRMLLVAMLSLVIGTLVSALAPNLPLMLVGRVVAGVAGGIFPLAFSVIRDEFPAERVPASIGVVSSLLGIGGGLGLVLPGPIVETLGYRWLFWIPCAVSALTAILITRLVPESTSRTGGRMNLPAAVTMAAGMSLVLVGLSESSSWGWGSPKTAAFVGGGVVSLGAWIAIELRSATPLIDMRLMRLRNVWMTNLIAFLIGGAMYASFAIIPAFVQASGSEGYGFGASVTVAGLFMLPTAALQLFVAPAAGILDRRLGARLQLLGGGVLIAGALVVLSMAHDAPWEVLVATCMIGIGLGVALASLANLVVRAVPAAHTGAATGMNTVLRTLGGAVFSQVVVILVAVHGHNVHISEHSYGLAFGFLAAVAAVSVPLTLLIPARQVEPGR